MKNSLTHNSKGIFAKLSTLLLAVGVLAVYGCEDQPTSPGTATETVLEKPATAPGNTGTEYEAVDETMQISPHMINLQSMGAGESIRAIIGLSIPSGYYLSDYDFTISLNGEDVTTAYDCYYCYIDDNLIISFNKDEIQDSPVTLKYVNTVAVAAVDGYFRVESDDDGYDTDLSRVANFEILNPGQGNGADIVSLSRPE